MWLRRGVVESATPGCKITARIHREAATAVADPAISSSALTLIYVSVLPDTKINKSAFTFILMFCHTLITLWRVGTPWLNALWKLGRLLQEVSVFCIVLVLGCEAHPIPKVQHLPISFSILPNFNQTFSQQVPTPPRKPPTGDKCLAGH